MYHLGKDSRWPEECTLIGCKNAPLRPHHHHMFRGHLNTEVCTCSNLDQPGTSPKKEKVRERS
jgi:hypothetical protein